ncbi:MULTISPECIES: low molecular weight protein-tyrosine-phosphatase [Flavobacteriaceae]|uniref:low molecular weight protein-tyrosine-phosphatase n=1 Tax=Flavobacteriaceae TaxID=49546 RepID=UPI0010AE08D1|nr:MULTISPECIES: low molecular weight protein-tyrosine-phosphatase [Flavobacteriaceae]NJB35887.1 low molecular weight phosphotyrosine protein phosphatase [Croceivirga sp. JEA036]TKD65826.1 low molecular weight phosphotyrosine protein phosphatase [Flavobacterium sp. ASW18X]
MTKVLMVCLGNICRSPLAEGILKAKVDPDKVYVDSAGTAGYHIGNAPDPRSVAVAKIHGLDISKQQCRKFIPEDFDAFNSIYVMDKSNLANVLALAKNDADRAKVKLLLSELNGPIKEVPDPYYGGDDGFEKVFQMIDEACTKIAKQITL